MERIIGKNILKSREMSGLTRKFLAEKAGISVQGLLKIERGLTTPNADTLVKIMDVLALTPNQLFGLEEITAENSGYINTIKRLRAEGKL